jgi:aspartate racemase
MLKTIGLIGGMSWESTTPYYEIINEYIMKKLGELHSAKILLSSIDFYELEKLQRNKKWVEAGSLILSEALLLQNAGCDFLIICSNTGNECVSRIQKDLRIPIIHIADTLGEEIVNRKIKKVGLLGTIYTMEGDFISERLKNTFETEVLIPDKEDRVAINKIIYKELCKGVIKKTSKNKYVDIINKLVKKKVDAIVLGCTEIHLLIKPKDVSIPLLDTTEIHALYAAKKSLS